MAKRRPSGDGMVRKREDGRWEGRIVIGHKENGDSIFRYIYADTQKELTAKLRQNIDAYQGVDLTEDGRLTLAEWLDRWLEQMALTIRPSTLERYRNDMERHVRPCLGQKPLTQLTASDLRDLYRALLEHGRLKPRPGQSPGLSPTTVHSIHTTLHQALQAGVEQRMIPDNPAAQTQPPKIIRRAMNVLTEEQMEHFLAETNRDIIWRDFFYTELTTGLRLGGICGLLWSDFDEQKGTLRVSRTLHREKGGRLVAGDTKTYAGTRTILLPSSTAERLAGCSGILVPGGFGDRGIEGMIAAVRYAREHCIPYFGICLGMQMAVIEFARHVLGWADASSSEFSSTAHSVIDLMPDQVNVTAKGGTMRLGRYPCVLAEGSRSRELYGAAEISERHRHRYEFNNDFRAEMQVGGMRLAGLSPDGRLVEIIELPDHPWFVGAQFHPEFKSRPDRPHPLFYGFVKASVEKIEAQEVTR